MIIALKLLALFGLVFLNGFFVASEFAIVKVRETRLAELSEQGLIRARVAKGVAGSLDAYLSACQLGITIASLGLGWMGEPLVSQQLEPILLKIGIHDHAIVTSISFAIGFLVITFLHIVFGELAPKSLAIRRTEGTTLWVAVPLRLFYWTFFPAIWLLNQAAFLVLRLIGVSPASDEELAHSDTELMMILSESARGGHISEREKIISERALRFADLKARQIMAPRAEIVYFSLQDPVEQSLAKARRNGFARYPLCETGLDKVVGIVHVRDALWSVLAKGKADLALMAREAPIVSEEDNLEKLLELFRETHIHMALVADEIGVVSGLVTLEDVLEQLVGAIQDEFDSESPWIKALDGGAFEVLGRAPLTSLRRRLGIEFDDRDVITISGYLTDLLGRFPNSGDKVEAHGWTFTVTRTDALKVGACVVEKKPETEPE